MIKVIPFDIFTINYLPVSNHFKQIACTYISVFSVKPGVELDDIYKCLCLHIL